MPRRGWEQSVARQDTCKHEIIHVILNTFRCQICLKSTQPITTSVNGKAAAWDHETWQKWFDVSNTWPGEDRMAVTSLNFFTPRPFKDEWDRGDRKEGFTYVLRGSVCQLVLSGGVPWIVSPQR